MTINEYVDWFFHELSVEAKKSGLVIKPEETWPSKHLFEYSREYHYKGSQVSAVL